MAFTRPRAAQIDFDVTNISDPLIRLNSAETGSADKDVGIVIERGDDTNTAFLYDESADQFVLVNTTEDGSTSGNVTISSYAGLQANAIVYGSLNDGTTTLTATVAELNYVDGVTSNIQTQIDNISSSFTLAADSGSSDTFTTGETLTIAGGTGIDTTVSDNNISVAIDSTVATLTDTQTLTNKTLDVPIVTGNLTVDTNTLFVDAANNRVGIGTTSPAYQVEIENTGANALLVLDRTDGAACFIEGQATRSAFGSVGATPLALAYNSLAVVTIGASGAITVNPDGDGFTFPTTDGSANQFLQTDGAGAITFASATVSDISDLTATATELNILDGVTSTTAEINLLDGASAGTVTANKAVIYDGNGGIVASGDINLNDADDQIIHGDTSYNQKQYVLYGTTTDATETEIFVGGTASSRIPVATNTTVFYEVDIVARRTDATGESGGWHLKSVADNFSNTVADVGTVYEVQVASDDANWAVDARADDTNDAIGIHVTGAAGKTVRWTAIVRTFEVAQ